MSQQVVDFFRSLLRRSAPCLKPFSSPPFARPLAPPPRARSQPRAPTILPQRQSTACSPAVLPSTNRQSTTSSSAARSQKASRAGTSRAWLLFALDFLSKFPAQPSIDFAPPVSRPSPSPISASVQAPQRSSSRAAQNP